METPGGGEEEDDEHDDEEEDHNNWPNGRRGTKRSYDAAGLDDDGTIQTIAIKLNGKYVQAAKSVGRVYFCKFYGMSICSRGDGCRYTHSCNIFTALGTVCHGNHPAQDHYGNTVAAGR